MQDLIKRLEAASGPDRELDVSIAKRVGTYRMAPITSNDPYFWILHYTASIDAALGLVPEGLPWELNSAAVAEIGMASGKPVIGIARGKNYALALCIAALRAWQSCKGTSP